MCWCNWLLVQCFGSKLKVLRRKWMPKIMSRFLLKPNYSKLNLANKRRLCWLLNKCSTPNNNIKNKRLTNHSTLIPTTVQQERYNEPRNSNRRQWYLSEEEEPISIWGSLWNWKNTHVHYGKVSWVRLFRRRVLSSRPTFHLFHYYCRLWCYERIRQITSYFVAVTSMN